MPAGKPTCLIIDDNVDHAATLEAFCKDHGYEVLRMRVGDLTPVDSAELESSDVAFIDGELGIDAMTHLAEHVLVDAELFAADAHQLKLDYASPRIELIDPDGNLVDLGKMPITHGAICNMEVGFLLSKEKIRVGVTRHKFPAIVPSQHRSELRGYRCFGAGQLRSAGLRSGGRTCRIQPPCRVG